MFRVEYASKVDENFDCVEVRTNKFIFNYFAIEYETVLKCKGLREESVI